MALPRVQPIIPTWRKEPADNPNWLFELKYDGFRALLYLEKGKGRLVWGRRNTLSHFDPLCDQLATELDVEDAILDGQVIAVDKNRVPPMVGTPARGTYRLPYYLVFDILWLNGRDLRSLLLHDRRRRLERILPKRSSVISQALSVVGSGQELFAIVCQHDLEGIVAKCLNDPYEPRVRWLKIKNSDYSQREKKGKVN